MIERLQFEEVSFTVGFDELPDQLAIFPLPGAVLYPNWDMPIRVFEPRYIALVDYVHNIDGFMGIIQPLLNNKGEPTTDLSRVGCAAKIISMYETDNGEYLMELAGVCRFSVQSELSTDTPYRLISPGWDEFKIDFTEDGTDQVPEAEVILSVMESKIARYIGPDNWENIRKLSKEGLINLLCNIWPFVPAEKQALLEAHDLNDRYSTMIKLIEMDIVGNVPETLQ